jgi:hypothetical protein
MGIVKFPIFNPGYAIKYLFRATSSAKYDISLAFEASP